tara:strand:- start:963 stop:1841 length:879 start_codon:yes stop_codon:yes gene_type:complete
MNKFMFGEFINSNNESRKENLKFAVIGHTEWITFLEVEKMPSPGLITHAKQNLELPAGGGTIIARTLAELNNEVHFFTSLGRDFYGNKSLELLEEIGLKLHIQWSEKPTRKGFSLVDQDGDRSITIFGDRLNPQSSDKLEWDLLDDMDGIFITAADDILIRRARVAKILCATPRVGLDVINNSKIKLDALIGSNLDPAEAFTCNDLKTNPKFIIKTEGLKGGSVLPGGRYEASLTSKKPKDSYGCGDSFAAGILYGLTANLGIEKAIEIGKILGRNCVEYFGPYPKIKNIAF